MGPTRFESGIPEFLSHRENHYLADHSRKLLNIMLITENIFLKEAKIIGQEEYIYNLGTLFYIDKPLLMFNKAEDKSSTQEQQIVSLLNFC